ncbi:patatin-like protein [Sphingomonas montana]|uniref:patatin-like protein n=1 Tax=Sphingomonas montana TaxID=1843236 RepID=UPI00096CC53A|nr:patatin-like protein [Sphingomonas montana]
MREKELRLALVCYGGISLAVYMHGITREIWHLARASRAYHADEPATGSSEAVYRDLIGEIEAATGTRLRVLVDIVAGASAGGINGIFLAQAIATGQSLDPLTALWLDNADVDRLMDDDRASGAISRRISRLWATPIARYAAGRTATDGLDPAVQAGVQAEVRAKLTRFVQARWFAPPFGGPRFTALLLDALGAMAGTGDGRALLPDRHPLDLFVTVTDFRGHPERLALHSPTEIVETEHRLTLAFSNRDGDGASIGAVPDLVFAGRATASFPGAFPPFTVAELDGVLRTRAQGWSGRTAFLARALPRLAAIGAAESAVLIDGSVLSNAPFRPAIEALRDRPAAREVDRRFVYIDPKPNIRSVQMTGGDGTAPPGFFQTILGAMSDIPREQPIRDNLEAIAARSARIADVAATIAAIRPEVEAAIDAALGGTIFLTRPTPARIAGWRARANLLAARAAGFTHAGYAHLKLASVIDRLTATFGQAGRDPAAIRAALWAHVRATDGAGAAADIVPFLRAHDLGFRIRRLRFVAQQVPDVPPPGCTVAAIEGMRTALFAALAPYLDRQRAGIADMPDPLTDPSAALAALAAATDLRATDDRADATLCAALLPLSRAERRRILLAYLGFPFYDIATLPLVRTDQGDELYPVKVDRIAPDDANGIRPGGAEATLKGINFNSFGAFFSRAWRENDYLWGRLHGIDRLIDILISTLPAGSTLPPGHVAMLKTRAFRAVLAEERSRLTAIPELFATLDREVG